MTIIAGFESGGRVYIGADSAVLEGGTYNVTIRSPEDSKVKRWESLRLIMGMAGDNRWIDMVKYLFTPPEPIETETPREYVQRLVEELRKCCIANGVMTGEKPDCTESSCLIGYQGQLYRMDSYFGITKTYERFVSLGAGDHFATAAMYAVCTFMKKDEEAINPDFVIEVALLTAGAYSGVVKPPYTIGWA